MLCGYGRRCTGTALAEFPLDEATAGVPITDVIFFNVACSLLLLMVVLFEWKETHRPPSSALAAQKKSGFP